MIKIILIIVAIIVVLLFAIALLISYVNYANYLLAYKFSSGNWIDVDGNVLIITNNGMLQTSHIKIGIRDNKEDGIYDVHPIECIITINVTDMLYSNTFSAKATSKDKRFKMKCDIVRGSIELFSNDKFYGTFYKDNIVT